MAAFVTATSQRTKVDSKNFVADHPIPLWHRSLSQCPSVPAVANVPLRSSPLCSSHASPDGAQLLADAHDAPFLLSCSPGWTGKDRLTFTDSSAVLWMWQVHPREWCILSQPCASPVPKEQPNDQGRGCSRRAPTALLLTRADGMGPAMSCPSTPRSRECSWIPALIVSQCFSQANHHWLPLPTSLQCHSKLIFIPVPFVLSSIHLHNILLGFFLFLLPITIPFSPLFP